MGGIAGIGGGIGASRLWRLLAQAAGSHGMAGGQAIDNDWLIKHQCYFVVKFGRRRPDIFRLCVRVGAVQERRAQTFADGCIRQIVAAYALWIRRAEYDARRIDDKYLGEVDGPTFFVE